MDNIIEGAVVIVGIEAVLVLLLVVSPGLIADWIYRFILWRSDPEESERLTRAVLLSVLSLGVLLGVSTHFSLSVFYPQYLTPSWWSEMGIPENMLLQAFFPWLSHVVLSIALAIVGVFLSTSRPVNWFLNKFLGKSAYEDSWQEFAIEHHGQWVFVKLTDGRHYYGELGIISGNRNLNIVLWNAYPYDENAGTYEITGCKCAFFPESQIASILVSKSPDEIKEISPYFGIYSLETGEKIDDEKSE